MTGSHRARRALAHLAEVDIALAVLALWCSHRDGDGPTATEGDTISYGPAFDTMGLPEQVGTVAHHVLHVALRHSLRSAGLAQRLGDRFDPVLFGLAADGIVNGTLQLAGHPLPRPAVRLSEVLEQAGLASGSVIDALSQWDVERLALALHDGPERARKLRKWASEQGVTLDLRPAGSGSQNRSQSAADWHNQTLRAMEAGRRAGSGIGRLGVFLADLGPETVPWEVHLRGLLARALVQRPKVSWKRPSSRWIAAMADAGGRGTAFEPGRQRSDTLPRIVVGLDASSSITDQDFDFLVKEARSVARRTAAEVHFMAFDTEVFHHERLDAEGWAKIDLKMLRRGGGTDYKPLFTKANSLSPSILLVLTDLDAELPPKPDFPVLWAVFGSIDTPVFGRVLTMHG